MGEIRRLRKGDAKSLFQLIEAINAEDNLNLTLTGEWLDYVLDLDHTGIAASFDRDNMTGLATCMINEVFPEQATVNVLVHPASRRTGTGSLLFEWVLLFADKKGVLSLEAYVKKRLEHSVSFARKNGFQTAYYSWEMEINLNNFSVGAALPKFLILTPASARDGSDYARVMHRCFGDKLESEALGKMLEDPSIRVWMLRNENETIGCIALQLKEGFKIGYIFDVAVIPEEQKKGYGSLLMKKCLKWLKGKGFSKGALMVAAENNNALNLYKSIGFEVKDVDLVMLRKLDELNSENNR